MTKIFTIKNGDGLFFSVMGSTRDPEWTDDLHYAKLYTTLNGCKGARNKLDKADLKGRFAIAEYKLVPNRLHTF